MEAVFFGLVVLAVLVLLPIVSFVSAVRTRARVSEIDDLVSTQKDQIERLQREVIGLKRAARGAQAAGPAAAADAVAPPADLATPPPMAEPPAPVPSPVATGPGVEPLVDEEPPPDAWTAVPEEEPEEEEEEEEEEKVEDVAPEPEEAEAQPVAARTIEPEVPVAPPPPRPPRRPPPDEPPSPRLPAFDWENLVGVKLFSAVAGIALLIAGVSFLRYSIERGWLEPPVRVAIGILVAVALLVTNELRLARRYPVTANALDAGAIALLFSTFFAAHALWNLIPTVPTFLLLALTAAVAVLLSIRRDSKFIAVLGLLGGFATPVLVSTGENRPIPLFAYLLLLNVGLAWVAYRKRWVLLTTLSLILTTIYQWAWVVKFLDSAQVPLAVGIFLIFPVSAFAMRVLFAARTSDEPEESGQAFERTVAIGAALPVLFALNLAAVPAYGARFVILFGFQFILAAGLLAIARAQRSWILYAVGALSTLQTFAVWLGASYVETAWPWVLPILAVFVCFYLFASPLADRLVAAADQIETAVGQALRLAGPLLLFVLPVLVAIEPSTASPWALFALALALLVLVAAVAIWRDEGPGYFVAAFFVVSAEAVWCARYLTIERLGTSIVLLVAFGLVYLAVPMLARRLERPLRPAVGAAVVLLASLALLLFLALGAVAPSALWGMALLLGILNAGLFIESAATRAPIVSFVGSGLSWLVVAAWWARTAARAPLLPSLSVVGGLALLMVAGHVWTRRRAGPDDSARFDPGGYLGLVAYVFLVIVAGLPALAVPPWPLFGVLAVVTLAFSTGSLALGQAPLHVAAVSAAALVLLNWVGLVGPAPWPAVGIGAGIALSAYALLWVRVSRAGSGETRLTTAGAAAVLFMAQFVAMVPGWRSPGVGLLTVAHLILLVAILGVAARRSWHALALGAVATTALAVARWIGFNDTAWAATLAFATPLYLTLVAYPIALGQRVGTAREPHLAAVVAGVPFFFFARHALVVGGFGSIIGVLPVAQAALMALLLRRLLAIEPPGERAMGRLALVAAAALAFVTVAIPLQLDREWITIGWALEGVALAWLFGRIPHRGLLWWSLALFAIVFARLALNPQVFAYAPRGAWRVFNWYLYTYAITAAAFIAAGWLLSRTDDRIATAVPRPAHLLPAAGGILLFLLLNIEIADFYAEGPTIMFRFGATLAQDLTYTIGWLVFGLVLLAVGIMLGARTARMASLGLIAVTVSKAFLYDLGRLGGLYRVGSFVGLAISLALVALALQKYVLARPKERT